MKVGVALGIAQGLEYMHSQSPPVAHFDIKPGNILLSDAGVPKISSATSASARSSWGSP